MLPADRRQPQSSASSCSAAYSRMVSSSSSRPVASLRTRLLTTSDSSTSRSAAQIDSAASSAKLPLKTARRPKSSCSRRVQQLVAPLDRRAQGLLPGGRVARARGQERQALVESSEELVRAEQRDACGGQLDRERQAVQPPADLADRLGRPESVLHSRGSLDEQGDGVAVRQRLDRVALLRFDLQRLPARDQRLRVGRLRQERRDRRRGLHDLLEVVEQEQQALAPDVVAHGAVGADGRADRAFDEGRVAECLKRDPEDAVGELLDRFGRELHREPRLAAAARPGQGQQAMGADESAGFGELTLSADDRRRLDRESRPVQRLQRRELAVAELEQPLPALRGPSAGGLPGRAGPPSDRGAAASPPTRAPVRRGRRP